MVLYKIVENDEGYPELNTIKCEKIDENSIPMYSFWFGDIRGEDIEDGVEQSLEKAVEFYIYRKKDHIESNNSQIQDLQEENKNLVRQINLTRNFLNDPRAMAHVQPQSS